MDREIKFRAWDIKRSRWFNDGFSVCESGTQIFDGDSFTWNVGEHVFIMQYTGLKDKNGKEIYEGDIVEWHDTGSNYPQTLHKKEVAEWRKPLSAIYPMNVIGNIYENPELLSN